MKRELLSSGLGADGQLGIRCPADSNILKMPEHIIGGPTDADGSSVVSVACGEKFSLFLADDGKVWSVGANEEGQLGRGTKNQGSFTIYPLSLSPGTKIIQIAAGRAHALAVAEDGRLFAWGSNEHGQLAAPANVMCYESPKRIADLTEVIQVACGPEQCIALCASGKVFTWGQQWDNANIHRPTEVIALAGIPIVRVAAGGSHFLALTACGDVFTWGQNAYGQLGTGDTEPKNIPCSLNMSSMHIVEIAAGYSHSVLLTQDGRLFAFGADHLGQLGLAKNIEKQTMPVVITELMGSHVSRVACGRCHTIAVVNGKAYSFGLNSSGQLANGMERNQRLPKVIEDLDHVAAVFSGWDQTFLIRSSNLNGMAAGPSCPMKTPTVISRTAILDLLQKKEDKMELLGLLESVFSSLSALNGSFLYEDDRRFGRPDICPGVDLDAVVESFNALASSEDSEQYADVIISSLEMSLFDEDGDVNLQNPRSVEWFHFFLILPWFHKFIDRSGDKRLHLNLAHLMILMSSACKDILRSWWKNVPSVHFGRLVQGLVSGLRRGFHKGIFDGEYMETIRLLAQLCSLNETAELIPIESFYLPDVDDDLNIVETYIQFKLDPHYDTRRCWYSYPFLLNGSVKADILHGEAILQQQRSMNQGTINLFGMQVRTEMPFFNISVRRQNLVHDTVHSVMNAKHNDLFKPLKVEFVGEEAEDGGGVKKEFFMLLFQQILSTQYGMFVEDHESHFVWFSGLDGPEVEYFKLLGILSAMAVYNNVLVAFPFPLALYKMLVGQTPTLDDLCELSPSVGKNLKYILECDCEEALDLTFTIDTEQFGEIRTVELKRGGAEIALTKENKHEYVELYVRHKLQTGVDGVVNKQFAWFANGFKLLIPDPLLSMFQPKELQEMVVGCDNYDWAELQQVVAYNGEYHAKHPAILAFWAAFFQLSEEDKKKFMQFLMGTTRLPVKGLSAVKISIHPCASHLLPAAHTCANQLDLPNLDDEKEQLRRLRIAIQHTEGFTLV